MKKGSRAVFAVVAIVGVFAATGIVRAQAQAASPEAHARAVLSDIVAGESAKVEEQYDATVKAGLPPGKLAEVWAQVTAQTGAFKNVADASSQQTQGYEVETLVCVFDHATLDTVIAFNSDDHISGIRFAPHQWVPPAYAKPDAFGEQAITVKFQHWELPGTLTMPHGQGPFPLVVLVQGSGPDDQDETIGPNNKPFKDLAWGLATRGIAVLRYTKRTLKYGAGSSDDPADFTVNDETVNDARAAVALAAAEPKVDPKRVYVLGHSLGGYLAPRIAPGDPRVAGLIILAGSSRPIEQIIVEQTRYLSRTEGLPSSRQEQAIAAAEQDARAIENPALKKGDIVDWAGAKFPASYFLDLRGYDPAALAARMKIPLLILQGSRDYQVRLADYDGWQKALAGRANVTFRLYPGLTHLFAESLAPGAGPGTPRDYDRPAHVEGQVIADISSWVLAGGRAKP